MRFKIRLAVACFIGLAFWASYTAASQLATSKFTIEISRAGATQQEADQHLTDALGAFALSLPGDSDIYQRNPDGSIITDGRGKPAFDRAKVEKRIAAFFDAAVDSADIASKADVRKAAAGAQIEQEEKDAIKDRKPVKEDKAIQPESIQPMTIKSTRSPARPIRKKRGQ